MDFFKSVAKNTTTTTTTEEGRDEKSSSSGLMSSAQLVAEAAQSTFHNESDKVDKPRVAGAAADLLGAAKDYGKLGEDGVGNYVGQAQDYLHKYSHQSSTNTAAPPAADPKLKSGGEEEKPAAAIHEAGDATRKSGSGKEEEKPVEASAAIPDAEEGGKLKSGSGEEEEKSPGDYLKMAQGFLGKN